LLCVWQMGPRMLHVMLVHRLVLMTEMLLVVEALSTLNDQARVQQDQHSN